MSIEKFKLPQFTLSWKEKSRKKIEEAMQIPGRDTIPTHPQPKEKLQALLRDERRAEARESKNEVEQLLRSAAISDALERAKENESKDSPFLIILNELVKKHSAGTLNLKTKIGMVTEQLNALQNHPDKTDVRSEAEQLLLKEKNILSHLIAISRW